MSDDPKNAMRELAIELMGIHKCGPDLLLNTIKAHSCNEQGKTIFCLSVPENACDEMLAIAKNAFGAGVAPRWNKKLETYFLQIPFESDADKANYRVFEKILEKFVELDSVLEKPLTKRLVTPVKPLSHLLALLKGSEQKEFFREYASEIYDGEWTTKNVREKDDPANMASDAPGFDRPVEGIWPVKRLNETHTATKRAMNRIVEAIDKLRTTPRNKKSQDALLENAAMLDTYLHDEKERMESAFAIATPALKDEFEETLRPHLQWVDKVIDALDEDRLRSQLAVLSERSRG
jgi:hypothetical protein